MDLSQSFEPGLDISTDVAVGRDTEELYLIDTAYETESAGHRIDMPIVHLFARRRDGSRRRLEVEGFRPHFSIERSDFCSEPLGILNDRRVIGVETDLEPAYWRTRDDLGFDELSEDSTGDDVADRLTAMSSATVDHVDSNDAESSETLSGDELARIIVRTPGEVGGKSGLRHVLEDSYGFDTYEADVPFVDRFLIGAEIRDAFEAPAGEDRVRFENWDHESDGSGRTQQLSPIDTPTFSGAPLEDPNIADTDEVIPRVLTFDIEVLTEGDGFPEPHRARKPITAIGAHDNYSDEYHLYGLVDPDWDIEQDELVRKIREGSADRFGTHLGSDQVHLYTDESTMLYEFNEWAINLDFDFLTGWNSNGFDIPYLIQRSYNQNARNITEYAELGNPGAWLEEYGGNESVSFSIQGRVTLDMLHAYRKTQFQQLSSYKLDTVAAIELGHGKVDLAGDELDDAWHERPAEFFIYNVRDVEAVVEVERKKGLVNLYQNFRKVTGSQWETSNNNGPMLDRLFLRRARDKGYALPTAVEPEQGNYHGAKVFQPVAGVHRNVVYPDLSSMYPNLFAMLNLGESTIIGDISDLEASEYTKEDCFCVPYDYRDYYTCPKGTSFEAGYDRDDVSLDRGDEFVDKNLYKGVVSPSGKTRETFDPEFSDLYTLKPSVRESFIKDTIDDLIDLKDNYRGSMYGAVKRVTNSCYGVMGDSDSPFRLFNDRVAEPITLAGRQAITFTAEKLTEYLQEHHDEDAVIVGGDTDSAMTSIPNAPDLQTALEWARVGASQFEDADDLSGDRGWYDEFAEDYFSFDPDEFDNRLAVDVESLASALFFKIDVDAGDLTVGRKKRYAEHIVWDEDDGWLDTPGPDEYDDAPEDPEDRSELKYCSDVTYDTYDTGPLSEQEPTDNLSITGFEFVRSDQAKITQDAQLQILTDLCLAPNPRERVEEYVSSLVDRITIRDDPDLDPIPLADLAKPKGFSKHLDDYGWKEIEELDDDEITPKVQQYGGKYRATPGPTYRGLKYADDHFPWENLTETSSPRKIPIEKVRSDTYPASFQYTKYPEKDRPDPPEVGDTVDAVTVEQVDRLPDGFVVDYDKIVEKNVEDKLDEILTTVGIDWDDVMGVGTQSDLSAFV